MRNFLNKTEITFAFKVGLLFSLILIASALKSNNNLKETENSLVQNLTIDMPSAVFTNF